MTVKLELSEHVLCLGLQDPSLSQKIEENNTACWTPLLNKYQIEKCEPEIEIYLKNWE